MGEHEQGEQGNANSLLVPARHISTLASLNAHQQQQHRFMHPFTPRVSALAHRQQKGNTAARINGDVLLARLRPLVLPILHHNIERRTLNQRRTGERPPNSRCVCVCVGRRMRPKRCAKSSNNTAPPPFSASRVDSAIEAKRTLSLTHRRLHQPISAPSPLSPSLLHTHPQHRELPQSKRQQ